MSVDPNGNVLVAGTTVSGFGLQDILMVKYDAFGNLKWSQTWGGVSDDDRVIAVRGDSSGSVYVLTTVLVWDQYGSYRLRKYSSSGVFQWQSVINGHGFDYKVRADLQIAKDDLPVVLTTDPGTTHGSLDCLTKVRKDGSIAWSKLYQQGQGSVATALQVASDGTLFVAGGTGADPIYQPQFELIKFTSDGVPLWERHGSSDERFDGVVALKLDASDNAYVAATSFNNTVADDDWFVAKYNTNGTKIYQDRSGIQGDDEEITGIAVSGAGELYVGGDWFQNSTITHFYKVAKYSATGTREWLKSYKVAINQQEETVGVQVDSTGSAYVVGTTQIPNG